MFEIPKKEGPKKERPKSPGALFRNMSVCTDFYQTSTEAAVRLVSKNQLRNNCVQ